jgi:CspA family cold shock protein
VYNEAYVVWNDFRTALARRDGASLFPVLMQHARERPVMARGTVKWFNSEKGFGFITPEGGGKDLFAHYSNISGSGFKSLNEGDNVEFEVGEGRKGPEATDIKVL